MVFNEQASDQDICSDIDFWCSSDDITYPLNDKARNSNFALERISSKIMQFDRTWKHVDFNRSGIPIATTDLTANIDNVALETHHLKISRVRIIGKDGEWKTLKPVDRRKVTDDTLNKDPGEPEYYDKIGRSIIMYPTPDYSSDEGVELEYQPSAEYFEPDDTIKQPGFNVQFHRLVSLYASLDWCALHNRDRAPVIKQAILEMEVDMARYFESRDIDDEPAFEVEKSSRGTGTLT